VHYPAGGLNTTLNFKDILTPKLEVFILVPKCTRAECLVKICPTLLKDIVLTMFGMHGQTRRQTHEQPENNACGHYVGGGIKSDNFFN